MNILGLYISGWWLIGLATAVFIVVMYVALNNMCKNARHINYDNDEDED